MSFFLDLPPGIVIAKAGKMSASMVVSMLVDSMATLTPIKFKGLFSVLPTTGILLDLDRYDQT